MYDVLSCSMRTTSQSICCASCQWAAAIESLDYDSVSDKSFGMKIRPDGDVEIDEKFWEEEFHIPSCQRCDGILKPDVSHFLIYMMLVGLLFFLD